MRLPSVRKRYHGCTKPRNAKRQLAGEFLRFPFRGVSTMGRNSRNALVCLQRRNSNTRYMITALVTWLIHIINLQVQSPYRIRLFCGFAYDKHIVFRLRAVLCLKAMLFAYPDNRFLFIKLGKYSCKKSHMCLPCRFRASCCVILYSVLFGVDMRRKLEPPFLSRLRELARLYNPYSILNSVKRAR